MSCRGILFHDLCSIAIMEKHTKIVRYIADNLQNKNMYLAILIKSLASDIFIWPLFIIM